MYWNLIFYNAIAWKEITGNVICSPSDQRDYPDRYLQRYAAATVGGKIQIGVGKSIHEEKRRSSKIFSRKKHSFGKLKHAETCNFTTDSTTAVGNLKPCLPFLKDLPFNLIRPGAERWDVPFSFWKLTGKTPRNQEVFMISIDFQFSWFICSLSERLMPVCSKLYVEFALIRCLCNRH